MVDVSKALHGQGRMFLRALDRMTWSFLANLVVAINTLIPAEQRRTRGKLEQT